MTVICDAIDVGAPSARRFERLEHIATNVLMATDPGPMRRRKRVWVAWTMLYTCWYEGHFATAREPRTGGPGRGFMQFEPMTLADVVEGYVLGPKPGLIDQLAESAGTTADTMRASLLAFVAHPYVGRNHWPADGVASRLGRWLGEFDSLGLLLMRYEFKRCGDHRFPPRHQDYAADVHAERYKGEHAEHWAHWWRRRFDDDVERRRRCADFEQRARQLDTIARRAAGTTRERGAT